MMKRVLCVCLAVLLVMSMAVCSASAASLLYGDVSGDGRVNNRDLGVGELLELQQGCEGPFGSSRC